MDLLEILRQRVADVPSGAHTEGLEAVLEHVEAAVEHLARGEQSGAPRAFNDAIYRTNHAFEGILKEAYRVLMRKSPKLTPAEIEGWLQNNKIVRGRILEQFSIYRVNWRNASTHEHRANFDYDEAFLAIVTVASFAIALLGQMRQAALAARPPQHELIRAISAFVPLVDQVAAAVETFSQSSVSGMADNDHDLLPDIVAHLRESFPHASITYDVRVATARPERIDVVLQDGQTKVAVEIARKVESQRDVGRAVQSLSDRMSQLQLEDGVLFVIGRSKIKGSLPGSANPRIISVPK